MVKSKHKQIMYDSEMKPCKDLWLCDILKKENKKVLFFFEGQCWCLCVYRLPEQCSAVGKHYLVSYEANVVSVVNTTVTKYQYRSNHGQEWTWNHVTGWHLDRHWEPPSPWREHANLLNMILVWKQQSLSHRRYRSLLQNNSWNSKANRRRGNFCRM